MKKVILGVITCMGLSLSAAEKSQTLTFVNKDSKGIRLTIRDKRGIVLKETDMRANETFQFPVTKKTKYALQAKELEHQYYLPLRASSLYNR